MQTESVHERLRQARMRRGEGIASIAQRIGVREPLLRAIEAGRYEDLPRGLYARAAVRAFAEAVGCDGEAALAECAPLLPAVEDPIAGLARVRGIEADSGVFARSDFFRLKADATRVVASLKSLSWLPPSGGRNSRPRPDWKLFAAAAIDSAIVLGLLLALVGVTVGTFGVPVLRAGAGPAFAVMGMLLATCYFAVFGGIGGQTAGARLVRLEIRHGDRAPIDLAGVAARALRSAARDALVIRQVAAWIGSISGGCKSSENRHDRQRAEQPAGS